MLTFTCRLLAATVLGLLLGAGPATADLTGILEEDFTTIEFRDVGATTAHWDTHPASSGCFRC